jgi:hypothetical protein
MIDGPAARRTAERLLDTDVRPHVGEEVVIIDKATRESPTHWAFLYNTKAYLETGDFRKGLAGNSPIFVRKADGDAWFGRTDISVEAQLESPGRGFGA